MNNNQLNFDPMTGQPINNTVIPNQPNMENIQSTPTMQQVPAVEPITNTQQTITTQNNAAITTVNTQQQMQNIPTVEQSKQEFINKTQADNAVKKEEKNDGPNIAFIVILFIIIFASIFFLFPFLLNTLG